jgi:lysophospholipase L1-like esterase
VTACSTVAPVRGEYIIETDAVGGYNSRRLRNLVTDRLTTGPAIDYAFVMVGTNDAIGDETSLTTVETYQENMRSTLQRLINAGVQPFVAEILPPIDELVAPRHPELTELPSVIIPRYNEALTSAALSTVPPTTVIPTHAWFLPNVGLGVNSWIRNPANSGASDGVHPTIEGSRRIALIYSEYVPIPQYESKRIALFGDSIANGQPHGPPNTPADFLIKLVNVTLAPDWQLYR